MGKHLSTQLCENTKITNDNPISPCVSPPTCASPTSLKPTLIEDEDVVSQYNNSDEHFLYPSKDTGGNPNNISVSGMSGTNADIPVDKENPMRCVECKEEFVNHFR
jgi:hypothetical protein